MGTITITNETEYRGDQNSILSDHSEPLHFFFRPSLHVFKSATIYQNDSDDQLKIKNLV